MTKYSTLISTSAIALAMLATPAFAQIDEVIVTSTKRQTTLQDTPVAVTVTSADTIEKAQILDILDLQSVVPSLRVSQLQNSVQTNFIIRGFGNGANNAGIEPSVGVFIDGVYRSRSAAQIGDLPVVERIEVLRGPQSTLFGKNASAGVISVVSAKPSFDAFGYVEGTVGNYDALQGKAYLTGPVNDSVAFSIGGNFNSRDGYADNLALDTKLNDRDRMGIRAQLLFQPVDSMEFRIIGDYDKVDEICCYAPNLVNGPTGGAISAFGGTVVGNPFDYETRLNFDPTNTVENSGISFHADVDLGGDITMTSITSIRKSEYADNGDVDFTDAPLVGSNRGSLDIDTFTQELRFASDYAGRFNWLAGVFYFDESLTQTDDITYGPAFRSYANILADPNPADGIFDLIGFLEGSALLPTGTLLQAGQGVFEDSAQDNRAINLFGQVDFDITDALTLTAGASYTDDKKNTSLSQLNTDIFSNINFGPGVRPLQFLPQLLAYPNAFESGQSKDDNVDYTVRLGYEVSDSLNVYASYATGYKATSWNLSRDSRPTASEFAALFPNGGAPFNLIPGQITNDGVELGRRANPEEAKVIELGLKAKFSQGSINVAVFDQSIKNFQSNVFNGTGFDLRNAEKQSVRGVELEAAWFPTDGLAINFGGTYLDPEYDEFTQSSFGDLSGTTPGGISELSTSTAVTYNFDVGSNEAFVRADWQYESDVDIQDGGDANPANLALGAAGYRKREINLINASAGVTVGDLDLSVWARNLFNDEFITTTFATVAQTGSFNGYANTPRTYGLTGRYNF